MAANCFISDNRPNIRGLVLAGSANIKFDVEESDRLDKRLKDIKIATIDVSYGMDQGLNQAITLGADSLLNVKFVHEKKVSASSLTRLHWTLE
jgi:peptide chain release factor subunit 1